MAALRPTTQDTADADPRSGSDAADDRAIDVLSASHASEQAFGGLVAALNVDERPSMVAPLYVGRGDYVASERDEARRLARERDSASVHLVNYLIGTPSLPDLLAEGLASLGWAIDDESSAEGVSTDDSVDIRHVSQRER